MKIKAVRGFGRERILYKVTRGFFKKVFFSRLLIIQHALIFRELWVEGQVLVVRTIRYWCKKEETHGRTWQFFFPHSRCGAARHIVNHTSERKQKK